MNVNGLIQQAIGIARDTVSKEAQRADENGIWVHETMKALRETRLTALVAPVETGGYGQGLHTLVRICEELGKAYSSAGLCFGMHCVGTAVIAAKATKWQKQTYLEPIAAGEHITTLALSEPGTGSHFYFPQTSLVPISDHEFIINGEKTFVTNGALADSYVISTVGASENAGQDEFSCVVLDDKTPGLLWGREWNGLGMRGNSSRSARFNNIRIDANHILGEKGEQLWYIFNVVAPYFLMSMSGTYLGIAQAAVEEASKSLSKRTYAHNGVTLAQLPVLQHRLGTIWSKVERTRRLIYAAAIEGDKGSPEAMLPLLASKAEIAQTAVEVVNEAMTLIGGIGYENNSFMGMLMRDARAAHIMGPTTDLLYTWIGRALLDQPLLTD